MRAALMRHSLPTVDAYVWMESHFSMYESQPNAKQVHIDSTFKESIHEDYVKSMTSRDLTPLALSGFKELWLMCFANVKIRKHKRVSGKCWTCAYIHEVIIIRLPADIYYY